MCSSDLAKGGDNGLEYQRHDTSGHRQAQQTRRPLTKVTRGFGCGDELVERRCCTVEKALACFAEPNASGRTKEQHSPKPCFQRSNGLADGRRRNSQLDGGAAKAVVPYCSEKGFNAFESAAADCVALLHNLSTLS